MLSRALGLLLLAIWADSGSIRLPCRSFKFTQSLRSRFIRSQSTGSLGRSDNLPTVGKAVFEAGDRIFLAAFPLGKTKYKAPYHAFLALNSEQLLQIQVEPAAHGWRWAVPEIMTRYDLWMDIKCKVEKPDESLKPIGLEKTLALAWRLRGAKLPYNLLGCNCRHYIDYLTYGRTFGQRGTWSYWKMNDRCPLYAEIKPETDVGSAEFKLIDNRKVKRIYPLPTGISSSDEFTDVSSNFSSFSIDSEWRSPTAPTEKVGT